MGAAEHRPRLLLPGRILRPFTKTLPVGSAETTRYARSLDAPTFFARKTKRQWHDHSHGQATGVETLRRTDFGQCQQDTNYVCARVQQGTKSISEHPTPKIPCDTETNRTSGNADVGPITRQSRRLAGKKRKRYHM